MILDFVPPRVAALLILLLGCTRPNPAFYPEGPSRDAAAKAAPDAAATAIASLDTAPLPPDTTAPAPDAALSLVFTEVRSSPGVVPASPGGKDFSDECETGQVLTGLVVTSGEPDLNGLNSVQGRCALAAVNTGTFTTGPGQVQRAHGTVGPTRQEGTCPPDQVVVGFEATTGQWIDRMFLYCSALTVDASSRAITVGPATRLPLPLGPPAPGLFELVLCEEGKVAVGILGASGLAVDWFALRCARPELR